MKRANGEKYFDVYKKIGKLNDHVPNNFKNNKKNCVIQSQLFRIEFRTETMLYKDYNNISFC